MIHRLHRLALRIGIHSAQAGKSLPRGTPGRNSQPPGLGSWAQGVGLLLVASLLVAASPVAADGPAEIPPLGFRPLPQELAIALQEPLAAEGAFRSLPDSLDWREEGIITSAKAQLDCGGCWAFAGIACLEAMSVMAGASPSLDLSEQYPLSCDTQYLPAYGVANDGCCGGTVTVFEFLRVNPAISEAAFPFGNGDFDGTGSRSCTAHPGWNTVPCPSPLPPATIWRVESWSLIAPQPAPGIEPIKSALQDGPVWLGFYVYDDFVDYWFFNADPEIPYRHTSGAYLGGHAVLAIGYNDVGHYWIVKNSWGTTGPFGDGTFRMDYSDNCDFGLNAAKITVVHEETPPRRASLGSIRALFR